MIPLIVFIHRLFTRGVFIADKMYNSDIVA